VTEVTANLQLSGPARPEASWAILGYSGSGAARTVLGADPPAAGALRSAERLRGAGFRATTHAQAPGRVVCESSTARTDAGAPQRHDPGLDWVRRSGSRLGGMYRRSGSHGHSWCRRRRPRNWSSFYGDIRSRRSSAGDTRTDTEGPRSAQLRVSTRSKVKLPGTPGPRRV
jgi:hypothetical protein